MSHVDATGAVYDRGYRPYSGPRGGRTAARWAVVRLSMRRALGLRREWRQKVLPWSLLGIASIPAIVNVGVKYLTRDSPAEDFEFFTFRDYLGVSTTLLLFIVVVAPDIICPDRRNRVLPLIFARPLTGADYVAAKVGALFFVLFGFTFLPQVVLYVGQMLVVPEGALTFLRQHGDVLWQVPISAALFALYWTVLALALSATTTRRVVAGVVILAVVFVTRAVAHIAVFVATGREPDRLFEDGSIVGIVDVLAVPLHVRDLVFSGQVDPRSLIGGAPGAGVVAIAAYAVVVAGSVGFLLWRYREAT